MPINYSAKRLRDRALFAHWDALPAAHFEQLGISRDAIKNAQAQLRGTIVARGDPTYDTDRMAMIFNPVFDPYPILIVHCAGEPDVAVALGLAAQVPQHPFTIRSSGHCTAGFSAGSGILIDVSALKTLTVDTSDPASPQVTVGTGVPFGDLNAALASHQLHVPGGECEDVCIGGYVQGGGFGFTSTTFGLNCDNVISMRVMLADGSIVIASQEQNYDLWWAMRGGTGGNFGVLLTVTYKLYSLDMVYGFALAWPLANAGDIANAVNVLMLLQQSYMSNSSYSPYLNLQVSLVYQTWLDPNQPQPPPGTTPQPYCMVRGLYVGDPNDGAAAIAPLQQMAGCFTQWTQYDHYATINYNLLNYPQGQPLIDALPYEDKHSRYVERELTADEWNSILSYFVTSPNIWSYMYLEFYGGAIASYPIDQSAFIHRNVLFNAVLDVFWFAQKDRAAAEQFLAGWVDLMAPMWNGHIYPNYPSLNELDFAGAYWGYAQTGLYAVKLKYDPLNAFRFEQAVRQPNFGPGGPGPEWQLPPALAAALNQAIDYTGGAKARPAEAA